VLKAWRAKQLKWGSMKDQLVLQVVTKFLIPFILMYGLYIQLHGEYSPGGGFQAGVVFAAAFIIYCLLYGIEKTKKIISKDALLRLCSVGVLTYAGVGVLTLLMGGSFLNYSVLLSDPVAGQKLGILVIELGVGITVFAVMLLIFYIFVERKED
jgi:multicomponent Na+:H+ antiporter subunit B